MDIIWKDIPGYEGLYQVNQWGEVYSLYTGRILKYSFSADGYKQYNLYKNKKNYIMMAHRAVALAFIPNPENFPVINHKDENKENCYYENLEWCSYSYNNKYNDLHIRIAQKNSNMTFQYDRDGSLVETYASSKEAARKNGFNDSCCSSVSCHNRIPDLVLGTNSEQSHQVVLCPGDAFRSSGNPRILVLRNSSDSLTEMAVGKDRH